MVAEAAQRFEQHRAVVLVAQRQRERDLALGHGQVDAFAVVLDGDDVRPLLRDELQQLQQLARAGP